MPLKTVRKLGIPTRKLSCTKTRASSQKERAMGKIRLKCPRLQILIQKSLAP
ncbi:hypothetical protein BHM03_00044911 [Ensete ventricosum]|nr:hypothetical protein BHM03_00044911 [Ensete ventricosum]